MSSHLVRASLLLLVAALFGISAVDARAALINGEFNQGADGLDGWTVSDPLLVSAATGAAVIKESDSASVVELSQEFTIDAGDKTLQLTLSDLVPGDDGVLPEALTMSLLDPLTNDSLVDTILGTTNFYIRDLQTGITEGEGAAGVTFDPSSTALPLIIRLDLSGIAAGTRAKLLFELLSGGPDVAASYTVDSIDLKSANTGAVPEPASLAAWSVAIAGIAGFRRLRRRWP